MLQRQARAGLSAADAEEFRTTASRVLARLQLAEGAVLPPPLQALARDIVLAPSLERAEALATELRRAVQLARAEREQQVKDTAQARALLAQLSDNAPPELVAALERVAAGVELLDGPLREATQHLLDTAAAQREQDEQAAAALVLQESLRDLGYQVDDIESTLFADGGSVHFRREGWDQYFVKLRVAPAEHTVNFNVVRARGAEENSERRRQDALAEDRWCSEFPKLLETLKARGLELAVTRRLGAGEVPVQTVDPASLPAVAMQDDDTPGAPVLRQRPLS
jgi:phosphoglycolate phosphatase-like HAD superfamily hydrolase